ncbi:MAG: hypothetical protein NW216_00225 [Hyphomicrobium sp.]|nr:hypothetical protein [Hyphomicrobium sp.]
MNSLALGLLIAVVAALVIRGLNLRAGVLQYPFLAAAVMAGWFLPQAIKLTESYELPAGAFALTMFYASAAMLAIWFGDRTRIRRLSKKPEFDERSLLIGAMILSAIGALAYGLILRSNATQTEEGLTTGIVTIYFFFYKAQYFGYALALLLYLQRPSMLALGIVVFNVMTLSSFILFGGRRGPAVDLTLITLCALWFQWRFLVPKWLMLGGIAAGAIFISAAGQYRSLVTTINDPMVREGDARLPTFDEMMQIDWLGSFTNTGQNAVFEVSNAIHYIAASWETLRFDYGLHYWNFFVFRFVPGQVVGLDLKKSLQFDIPDLPVEIYGYVRHIGTTYTGFADTFMAFGPLGVLVFYFIARLMRGWWVRGMDGSIKDQYYYCTVIGTSLHAVTHATEWLFIFIPQVLLFTWFIFRAARRLRHWGRRGPRDGRLALPVGAGPAEARGSVSTPQARMRARGTGQDDRIDAQSLGQGKVGPRGELNP